MKTEERVAFSPEWHYQDPVDWRDTDLDEEVLRGWFRTMLLSRQIDIPSVSHRGMLVMSIRPPRPVSRTIPMMPAPEV